MAKSGDFDSSSRLITCPGIPTKKLFLKRKPRLRHDAKVMGPVLNRHVLVITTKEMRRLRRIKMSRKDRKKMRQDMKQAVDRM